MAPESPWPLDRPNRVAHKAFCSCRLVEFGHSPTRTPQPLPPPALGLLPRRRRAPPTPPAVRRAGQVI
uniref:Uncharacterized protein n=1 Tax=Oryza rufipogon TaxID=4529 RepID=A0A0E0P326_ORYRU